jgi:hypothetical protein
MENKDTTLFTYGAFYATARNFLKDIPGQPSSKQTALIPWVQSIVIQHYMLGKTVFF